MKAADLFQATRLDLMANGTAEARVDFHHRTNPLFRYKFLLQFFPNGKDETVKEYCSMFLHILDCPSQSITLKVNLEIQTLDDLQSFDFSNNNVTIRRRGIITVSRLVRRDQLISLRHQFLPNDRLTIVCILDVYEDMKSISEEAAAVNLGRRSSVLPYVLSRCAWQMNSIISVLTVRCKIHS
ncbi:unnamed protein product [Soboliphyme baturini]|uniref:C2 domain-containing protein n=1 Tax=Soboliphyme baturini TaxID=241478 RepID=A0A183I8Z2_9BILA|nr:unnamed protein product [Soboliphyme baturini]